MEQRLAAWIATERPQLAWRQTLLGVAERHAQGEEFGVAVREFLDIAESPAAFRRRGIFISEGALRRV